MAFWLVQLCLVFHPCCQIISAPKLFCFLPCCTWNRPSLQAALRTVPSKSLVSKKRAFTLSQPSLFVYRVTSSPHLHCLLCFICFPLKSFGYCSWFPLTSYSTWLFFFKLSSATKRLHHMATLESLYFTTGLQEVNINKGTFYLLFICLDDGKINLFWTPGLRFAAGGRVALCTVCA